MRPRTRPQAAHRLVTAAALALCLLAAGAGTVLATQVSFGTPTAVSKFGQGIVFTQPYSTSAKLDGAEILIDYPGAVGPSATEIVPQGSGQLQYRLDASGGEVLPNDVLVARWRVTLSDGTVETGPDVTVTYADDRFAWQTATQGLIRMHWYQYSKSQGESWARIGADGLAKAVAYIGAVETVPIDVYVYRAQQDLIGALGPGTSVNVGGRANEPARTCYALIEPSYVYFGASVIPHELTHVVFWDATHSPYGTPPHWLNEGMATYLADGYDSSNRDMVKRAAKDGSLMPLKAIANDFPTSADRFALGYAEGTAAVDYFVAKYGKPAMNTLLLTYGKGATDDEAFGAAISKSADQFDVEWLAAQGVTSTPSFGPQPAPTGPMPPGWVAGGSPGATASPDSGGSGTPTATSGSNGAAGGGQPSDRESKGSRAMLIAGLLACAGLVLLGLGAALHAAQRRAGRGW